MRSERSPGDPAVRRKLADLRRRSYNFDPARRSEHIASGRWHFDRRCRRLPSEAPGPPTEAGSWAVARRLMLGYEFADPSLVRAFYDPEEPLEGRTMLLELRFRGLLRFDVGTRVAEVYDERRIEAGREARVWGWAYRTLEGHLEMGQMDWQVWKWLEDGGVEFRIESYSRRAPERSPLVRLGFRLFGRREQLAFLDSTVERIEQLTRAGLEGRGGPDVRETAQQLTARPGGAGDESGEAISRRLRS